MTFRQPIHVGELVTFTAAVNFTGRSSMEIGIKVVTENIRSKLVRHTNSCYFTMVAVDDDGKPTEVPPLQPATRSSASASPPLSSGARCAEEMEARQHQIKAAPAA